MKNRAGLQHISYIPELDGIRGLAVWMVLAAHLLGGWAAPQAALERIPRLLRFVIGHGWMGVDLFFVLSGFLITGILVDSRDNPRYFRNFYARRFLRIIPLYFVAITAMWLCYGGPARYFLLSYLFLANFAALTGPGAPHGAGIFWSLAVEEHFYLAWPLLVRFLSRRRLAVLAAAVVIASPLLRGWAASAGVSYDKIYAYSYYRFDGLALGALLALWVRARWATPRRSLMLAGGLLAGCAAVTVIGIPYGVFSQHSTLRFLQAELVFGAFLTGAVALQGSAVTSPLRWRFAKWSGDLSYCAYLVHLALGDALERGRAALGVGDSWGLDGLGILLARAALLFLVTLAVTLLSRRYLEQPALKLKRYFEYDAPRAAHATAGALEAGAAEAAEA